MVIQLTQLTQLTSELKRYVPAGRAKRCGLFWGESQSLAKNRVTYMITDGRPKLPGIDDENTEFRQE